MSFPPARLPSWCDGTATSPERFPSFAAGTRTFHTSPSRATGPGTGWCGASFATDAGGGGACSIGSRGAGPADPASALLRLPSSAVGPPTSGATVRPYRHVPAPTRPERASAPGLAPAGGANRIPRRPVGRAVDAPPGPGLANSGSPEPWRRPELAEELGKPGQDGQPSLPGVVTRHMEPGDEPGRSATARMIVFWLPAVPSLLPTRSLALSKVVALIPPSEQQEPMP